MANNELTWEKTTQYNVGIDYGFLNNRISGSVDVYKTKTKDLLLDMTIPSLTGYVSTLANVGKTSGWGIDLQLNAIPVQTNDFTWNTTLTWSMDRSQIDALANGNTESIMTMYMTVSGRPQKLNRQPNMVASQDKSK